jgi:hypothetical protein
MDNDEGILYKVLKVYRKHGAVVVDRVIFETDKPNKPGGIIDCVYLSDILQYPIILGKSNPRHSGNTTSSIATARQDRMSPIIHAQGHPDSLVVQPTTPTIIGATEPPSAELTPKAVFPVEKSGKLPQPQEGASTRQQAALLAKRLRTEANAAAEVKNAIFGSHHRNRTRNATSNAAFIKPFWDTEVSKVIADWSIDHIPEAMWELASYDESILFDTNSSSIELLNSERSLDLRENKFEPKHHTEAMSRLSERIF